MSETSVSVVTPPSGMPAMISTPLSLAHQRRPLLGQLGPHAQVVVLLEDVCW